MQDQIEFTDKALAVPMMNFIQGATTKFNLVVSIGTLVLIILNLFLFTVISHAIAGPIEKLKIHLTKKANGEQTGAFFIRKDDFFAELPEYVNKAFVQNKKE
jgi:hypothetical protein